MYNLVIADDNIQYVKKLANRILKENHNIRLINIATDGLETYQFLNDGNIDILILDIEMPIYRGIELLNKVIDENKIILPDIILLSGYSDAIIEAKHFGINVQLYLDKLLRNR